MTPYRMLLDNPHRQIKRGSKRRDIMLIALEKESGFNILFNVLTTIPRFLWLYISITLKVQPLLIIELLSNHPRVNFNNHAHFLDN